ncbi:4-hydroxy-tetrahydrodipicolinate synthase [Marinobacterium mangrovicola]|uniref:4-hydroxy-tetrahydrodipicolinate synthase n=1 Tax=Marinobacterium mangrovicola TaxID=1476959 RepID=A0A4R1GNK1_9GAMM|nr:4-hydroxy-tetrahydrodipicolinate synthase [Marinobacterium mangrovicola]TCK08843.1 dihydrodipicolinate synthase [Marinobacterium mangrovicola]
MIRGSIVALVTPMHANGDVDWDALDKVIDLHLKKGTAAIGAVGTTGESATLDYDEHLEVIKHTIKRVGGQIPVVAGTGANSTREAIMLTRRAKDAGADYSLLVTPYYNKPTQEGMYQHFKAIADAVDIPQILYNVPGRTGCDMKPETVFRLMDHPNIVGIKEATGDLDRAKTLIDGVSEDFAVYSGDDGTAIELILLGGQGNISVTANVVPAEMAELCQLGLDGKVEEARALQQKLMPLHTKLFVEANPIPVKWAMHEMGLIENGIRLPLTILAEQYHEEVRNALRECGVI